MAAEYQYAWCLDYFLPGFTLTKQFFPPLVPKSVGNIKADWWFSQAGSLAPFSICVDVSIMDLMNSHAFVVGRCYLKKNEKPSAYLHSVTDIHFWGGVGGWRD